MSLLKIAVAGAGVIGRAHIALISQNARCQLCAVADPSQGAQVLAQEHGVAWFATLDELLASVQVDGVVLATPNALHVPQALQCIAAGVPVLVEKPLAHTVADARQLVQAAHAHDAKILVGHHRAHSPIMREAKAVIDSRRLGRVVSVMRSAMSRLFREEQDTRELIKLKAIYEHLESISDRCEDVANLIEGIVLENS